MLKCLKDVGVRSSHFKKRQREPVVAVKAGDILDIKESSVKALLESGYFEEYVAPKKEEPAEENAEEKVEE